MKQSADLSRSVSIEKALDQYYKELRHLFSQRRYISFRDLENFSLEKKPFDFGALSQVRIIGSLMLHGQLRSMVRVSRKLVQIKQLHASRERHNTVFLSAEKQKKYVYDGHMLDEQQIEAVVACEDASLVLAPAGSGKTASLLAKVDYLHNELGMAAKNILVVAFTRKVAEELKERVSTDGVDIRTFHGLGNAIITPGASERKLILEREIDLFIGRAISRLCGEDEGYAKKYNDYLLFYHTAPQDPAELATAKERVAFNKTFLKRTLQSISMDKSHYDVSASSLGGEYVKSKEEQIIANWLYINQIPYTYEKQYAHLSRKYKPDFTIRQFDNEVYLEHFAINKDGTSHYENYVQQMEWKRATHRQCATTLIESYSYQWTDGTLLTHIEAELKRVGVKAVRRSEQDIYESMANSLHYRLDIESFRQLVITFLTLQKSAMLTLDEVREIILGVNHGYTRARAEKFMQLYEPLYEQYHAYLKSHKRYDFSDMINEAVQVVSSSPRGSFPYEYILIDEVQDLSLNRYKLIKALLANSPNAKLFAVGDDWQSIFRFAGSDLTLIRDFEQTFNLKTHRTVIGTTYRFGRPTTETSSQFVQKNPSQSKKPVVAHEEGAETPIQIKLHDGNEARLLHQLLEKLWEEFGEQLHGTSIQLIGRYNRDIRAILEAQEFSVIDEGDKEIIIEWTPNRALTSIRLQFCSMHKAKGMTRDIVIVLNMNTGNMGMPASQADDPIINLLLVRPDPFPYAEERRLFYVAITRAKQRTYILANRKYPSPFLFELSEDLTGQYQSMCPECGIGELLKRTGRYGDFISCSNFAAGCTYTRSSGGHRAGSVSVRRKRSDG